MRTRARPLVAALALLAVPLVRCGGGGSPPSSRDLVAFTTTSLPPATAGVAYDATIGATGPHAPITFHVYDNATHCWDCKFADGRSKIDVRGNKVSYRYDEAATRDTMERIFAFFAKAAEVK